MTALSYGALKWLSAKCSQSAAHGTWLTTAPNPVLPGGVPGRRPGCEEQGLCGQTACARPPHCSWLWAVCYPHSAPESLYTWAIAEINELMCVCCLTLYQQTVSAKQTEGHQCETLCGGETHHPVSSFPNVLVCSLLCRWVCGLTAPGQGVW